MLGVDRLYQAGRRGWLVRLDHRRGGQPTGGKTPDHAQGADRVTDTAQETDGWSSRFRALARARGFDLEGSAHLPPKTSVTRYGNIRQLPDIPIGITRLEPTPRPS